MSRHDDELDRIRRAYNVRDAGTPGASRPGWADPAYRFQLQRLEWQLLQAADASGVSPVGARVLEVGCGAGYFANRFSEYGATSVAGIDLMESRVQAARERYPRLEFVVGDAASLPWPDESFDIVAQITCLSSILDPEVRALVGAEMWRVVRARGIVLSFDVIRPHALLTTLRRLRGQIAAASTTETVPIERSELSRLFGTAGRVSYLSVGASDMARRRRWLAEATSVLPLLRTHMTFTARKP
jgi:ubiquinone/menaquinone biosynthesis C-methylase UbiE